MLLNSLKSKKVFPVILTTLTVLSVIVPTGVGVHAAEIVEPTISTTSNLQSPIYFTGYTEQNVAKITEDFAITDSWGNVIGFDFTALESLFPEEQVNSESYIKIKNAILSIYEPSLTVSNRSVMSCIRDAVDEAFVGEYTEAIVAAAYAALSEGVAAVAAAMAAAATSVPEIGAVALIILAGGIVKNCVL